MLSPRNVQRIKCRAPESLKVMLGLYTLATTRWNYRLSFRSNRKHKCACGCESCFHSLILGIVEPISDEDADHSGGDCGSETERFRCEFELGETFGAATMVGSSRLGDIVIKISR